MCLVLYLGVDRPVPGFGDVALGAIGLDPAPRQRPAALAGKAHVYAIADRMPTGWNCSCIFLDDILPWEIEKGYDPADPETTVREGAYAGLRDIARAALDVDAGALVFSTWSGGEGDPPEITRDLAPDALVSGRYLFDDVLDRAEGGGMNPPILIRLKRETSR